MPTDTKQPAPADFAQAARILVALRAWQAAWRLQGDAKVYAMTNAARLTDEALERIQ